MNTNGKRIMGAVWLIMSMVALSEVVASPSQEHQSEYVGQEDREIKTLSPEDIEELRNGDGWGMALAAELNGVPGPAHLLPMADEIELSDRQIAEIETKYQQMRNRAIPLGEQLIELERQLNNEFAGGTVSQESLRLLLDQIGDVTADLRYAHLVTHLSTPAILSAHQIALYNRLRGYNGRGQAAHGH